MRHFLILLLIVLDWNTTTGQGFEVVDKQESFTAGSGQIIHIPLKIKNTTDKSQFFIFRKIQDDAGGTRKGYFCWNKNCLEPDMEEFSKKLEPGETLQDLNYTLETGFLSGTRSVKFEIFPRGFPQQSVEHSVSVSIEDRATKARVFGSREITVHDVYPNPVTDQAFIDYNLHDDMVKAKVVIHNILGKYLGVYDLPATETKIRIQTEELPAGVYFYTLYINNEGVLTRKLIVKK